MRGTDYNTNCAHKIVNGNSEGRRRESKNEKQWSVNTWKYKKKLKHNCKQTWLHFFATADTSIEK